MSEFGIIMVNPQMYLTFQNNILLLEFSGLKPSYERLFLCF